MLILLIIIALFWFVALIDAAIGLRRLPRLEDSRPATEEPLLSVIIAARDEEQAIEQSIRSQLQQNYRNVEWIVVNDRSTDRTGEIIELLAAEDLRVQPVHINSLPSGWLGKNHALYNGYQQANGDYLLFTDADVLYEKTAFQRAVSYIRQTGVGHVTIAPQLTANTFWLQGFIYFFLFGFGYFKRPWKANDDRSRVAMGIGAFNLLTRSAYERIGTHEAIAMRPDDDLQMGVHVKKAGEKQRLLTAMSLIKVNWYNSLTDAIRGLEKNTLAGLYYRYWMVAVAAVGITVSHLLPFVMLFAGTPMQMWVSGSTIVLMFLLYTLTTRQMAGAPPVHFIVMPILTLLFIYTIVRAAILTKKRNGILWRGTHYTLDELRQNDKG
ncbi:glycosyltransferase family 2 protein [Bacillus tianshenii]|nr:glycosyltransferase family 2 protein [Bacillus tianshenii]